jgi:hypothetical protein
MNGYVEAGYVVALGVLGGYAGSLVIRERRMRQSVIARANRARARAEESAEQDAP